MMKYYHRTNICFLIQSFLIPVCLHHYLLRGPSSVQQSPLWRPQQQQQQSNWYQVWKYECVFVPTLCTYAAGEPDRTLLPALGRIFFLYLVPCFLLLKIIFSSIIPVCLQQYLFRVSWSVLQSPSVTTFTKYGVMWRPQQQQQQLQQSNWYQAWKYEYVLVRTLCTYAAGEPDCTLLPALGSIFFLYFVPCLLLSKIIFSSIIPVCLQQYLFRVPSSVRQSPSVTTLTNYGVMWRPQQPQQKQRVPGTRNETMKSYSYVPFAPMLQVKLAPLHTSTYPIYSDIYIYILQHILWYDVVRACNPSGGWVN